MKISSMALVAGFCLVVAAADGDGRPDTGRFGY
jgi:hypothetical protein